MTKFKNSSEIFRFPKFKEIKYFKTKDSSTSSFGFKKYGFSSTNQVPKKFKYNSRNSRNSSTAGHPAFTKNVDDCYMDN